MHIDLLKKRYNLDHVDLPHQNGAPNVVQMHSIDTENYMGQENGRPTPMVRHKLWLYGCKLPLSLNNTRLDIIGLIYGPDTDGWAGQKLALQSGAVSAYGKTKMGILIIPQAPAQDATLCVWPERLRMFSQSQPHTLGQGQPPSAQLPPGTGAQVDRKAPIGTQLAVDLLSVAHRRGKDAGWIARTLGDLGCQVDSLLPPEFPGIALQLIKPVLASLPVIKPAPDASTQTLWRAAWSPPAREMIDTATGDVKPAAGQPAEPDPDDDIPF